MTDGPASFTVQVADAENPAATATATESITVADQLAVTTTSLPGGVADQPYSATLGNIRSDRTAARLISASDFAPSRRGSGERTGSPATLDIS